MVSTSGGGFGVPCLLDSTIINIIYIMKVKYYHQVGELVIVKIIKSGLFTVVMPSGTVAPVRFKTKDKIQEFAEDYNVIN